MGLFDRMLCMACLTWVRSLSSSARGQTAQARKAGKAGKKAVVQEFSDDEEMADAEDATSQSVLTECARGLAGVLRSVGFSDQRETVQEIAAAFAEVGLVMG